jgi:hypothetical protein
MAAMALRTRARGLPNWAAPPLDGALVADGVGTLEVDKLVLVLLLLLEVVLVVLLDMDGNTG